MSESIQAGVQRELERRAHERGREQARAEDSRRKSYGGPRLVDVEHAPELTRVTIRVRSEGCAMLLFLCLVSLAGFALVELTLWLATRKLDALIPNEGQLIWLGVTLAITMLAWHRWPTRIVLTSDAYVVYRWGMRRRIGPRSELSVRNKDFYGPRLNVSVYRRWNYEFWGIEHPDDRAMIDALGCKGRI